MASISKEANMFMDEVLSEEFYFKVLRDPSIIKADWRELKLDLVLGDFKLKPDIDRIRYRKDSFFKKQEGYWPIIVENKDAIITGSLSLKAFGIIDREASDVDIIISDKNILSKFNLMGRSYDYNDNVDIDHIGYYMYRTSNMFGTITGKWNIEYFVSTTATFIECDGFKFHHPLEVMEKKIQMLLLSKGNAGRMKDIKDLYSFLSKIRTQ